MVVLVVLQDRLQTVCSDEITEHAFHLFEGFLFIVAVIALLGMIVYLYMSSFTAVKRGLKELVLCGAALAITGLGLLLLMTTSTQDATWVAAVVPARLFIILYGVWTVISLQVLPPILFTARDIVKQTVQPHSHRRQDAFCCCVYTAGDCRAAHDGR